MHVRDWYELVNPSQAEVEALAVIPGVKFNFTQGRVSSARLHRSVWPLALVGEVDAMPAAYDDERTHILRPYQLADVPFMLKRRGSILGYEMRLGKTVTATVTHEPADGPLLVVGPLIARDVWRYWIEKIHNVTPVALESRHDIALPGYQAYFCHFDVLDAHSAFLQTLRPATFIIDEIHMLQARKSLRMSTCSLIAANSQRIIGLSGTPMWSNPRSMWPILNLLAPGAWGSEFDFCQRYMNANQTAYGWKYTGTKNESEFQQRLTEVIVRRTWAQVAPALPATVNVVEHVEIGGVERARLELAAERARLATGNPRAFDSAVAHTAVLRKKYGLAKVKRAVELAERAMADGHKVVIWTWHVEVADKLGLDLNIVGSDCVRHAYAITAEQSQDHRAGVVSAFMSYHRPTCIVVPLAVGGVAIDLSSADLNIFVELDWIPATNYQASMRVFKPGRPHSNVFLFADIPVERRLAEVLGANEACQTAVGLGYDEIANRVLGR